MSRFEIGDRVLYCPFYSPFRAEASEADVLAVERLYVKLQLPLDPELDVLPEDAQLAITEEDVYLLAPARRPFLDDVDRTVRRRFHRRAADAMYRYWLEEGRLSTGNEDDATLTELLRKMKAVRAQAWADGDRAFEALRAELHAQITGPDDWREHYRSWLTDEPIHWKDEDLDAARAMRERCVEAAERLGLDEVDL